MPFQITARTILQLGAELISSDAIAFYELIKNAFDAGADKIEVRVVVRLQPEICRRLLAECGQLAQDATEDNWRNLVESAISAVNLSAPESTVLKENLEGVTAIAQLRLLLEEANYIQFSDSGEGMSLQDLRDIYLVIGTRSRREQRRMAQVDVAAIGNTVPQPQRPILGEKGLGRLSVMRLGEGLRVQTTKAGEDHYNVLEVDWSRFSHDSNALLESIEVEPVLGCRKEDVSVSGTVIRVFKLNEDWSLPKIEAIAREELSKFTDPFTSANRKFAVIWFNNEAVVTSNLNTKLFKKAHAFVSAEFEVDGPNGPRLKGYINYDLYRKEKTFEVEGAHLASVSQSSIEVLKGLGPFSMQLYWFNRRILEAIEGIGTAKQVKDLVKQWAGGLMVFRDGFRVYPYGGLQDDWLKIDPDALASQGYKVNRRQIIGKVDISLSGNPALVDQTNREGLRDSPEKQCLIGLLRHILNTEFKRFLNAVEEDRSKNEPADLGELEGRLAQREQELNDSLTILIEKHPMLKNESSTLDAIRETLAQSRELINEVRKATISEENRREVTLHLAGLGLMVDIIAHELYRSTRHALTTVQNINKEVLPAQTKNLFSTLSSQLSTIQNRLKILDPLSPAARQRKEIFDLNLLVEEVLTSHQPQFDQEGIQCRPVGTVGGWRIKAVRGMFVQILENLIHNSVYWLRQEKLLKHDFRPEIIVELDKEASCIRFRDNGPGISRARRVEVFLPFFTTKPPGAGKGLGLYISREIAQYHGAELYLAEPPTTDSDTLNTFVLDLSKMENI